MVHKFQFSVTTKFFVIESSSKILENELFEQDQWFSFQVTKKQVETIPNRTKQ